MSQLLLCIVLLLAILAVVSADFSCFFSDTICKSITCRSCKIAACINGDCTCTFCD